MSTQTVEVESGAARGIQVEAQPVGALAKAAYERRLAEIQAVPNDELTLVTVDVRDAVATVLGAVRGIQALREAMGALPTLKAALVDGLEDYAWATSEANGRYEHALAPSEALGPLLAEAMKMRETFRLDAVALAHRGLVDPGRVAAFKGRTGYKNVAFDVMEWAFVMRECWREIHGRSALSVEEIDAATKLGERLLAETSFREQQPERVAETALVRQQALTLLMRAYDEVRRALTFLRWQENDVESIAPSLFLKNGRRRSTPSAGLTPRARRHRGSARPA